MDLGPHAAFIVAAYVAMAVVLSGLVAWLLFDGWRQARALEALEARGVKRRSASTAKDGAT
jgi:heme exporter protein D